MLKRLILAFGLLLMAVNSIGAIDMPLPPCYPCDDPPPSQSGGGN